MTRRTHAQGRVRLVVVSNRLPYDLRAPADHRSATIAPARAAGPRRPLFRIVEGKGLTVCVGQSDSRTRAVRRLPSAKAVHRFLEELVDASEAESRERNRGGRA